MKTIFTSIVALAFSSAVSARGVSYINGLAFQSAHCEASTYSGRTEFTFLEGRDDAESVTDTILGRGIVDYYEMPAIGIYSPTAESDTMERGGVAFVSFTYKKGSPSSRYNRGVSFVLTEKPVAGTKVYNVQLWIFDSVGGYPNPMQTHHSYKGEGSCEIKLIKKK